MRVATYNVQNLVDPTTAEAYGVPVKTDAQLAALAGTIGEVAADVLLLQEVGSNTVVTALNERLRAPYPYLAVLPGNSTRGIHLGILSRHPFRLSSHRDDVLRDDCGAVLEEYDTEADAALGCMSAVRFQRDLMLAEVELGTGEPLALFNVHLKSKTNRPWRRLAADVIRRAEVHRIVARVAAYQAANPARPVLLAGDLNDTRSSAVLAPLFALPLSDPLGEGFARTGRNPSSYWPKRRMRLDFLLLCPRSRAAAVPGSGKIHASARARRASDHYPVSIDLALPAG